MKVNFKKKRNSHKKKLSKKRTSRRKYSKKISKKRSSRRKYSKKKISKKRISKKRSSSSNYSKKKFIGGRRARRNALTPLDALPEITKTQKVDHHALGTKPRVTSDGHRLGQLRPEYSPSHFSPLTTYRGVPAAILGRAGPGKLGSDGRIKAIAETECATLVARDPSLNLTDCVNERISAMAPTKPTVDELMNLDLESFNKKLGITSRKPPETFGQKVLAALGNWAKSND